MPLFIRRFGNVFHSGPAAEPSAGSLEAFRRDWLAARRTAPALDGAWEDRVMRAVRLQSAEEGAVPQWLAQRLRPLAVADAAIVLLATLLFWQAGDPASALADYAQALLSSYEVFF